jgi:hypothetical protein
MNNRKYLVEKSVTKNQEAMPSSKDLMAVEFSRVENKPVNKRSAIDLMRRFPKGLKKLGINVNSLKPLAGFFTRKDEKISFIASGTKGSAFDVGGGKVFKVTPDRAEARAAAKLLKNSLDSVVKYYAVVKFADTGVYGILQEMLVPLSSNEAREFDEAVTNTKIREIMIKLDHPPFAEVEDGFKYVLNRRLETLKKEEGATADDLKDEAEKAKWHWHLLVSKYHVNETYENLLSAGIKFHDFHAGNLAHRGNKSGPIIVFDLGYSKVQGDEGALETLKEFVRHHLTSLNDASTHI